MAAEEGHLANHIRSLRYQIEGRKNDAVALKDAKHTRYRDIRDRLSRCRDEKIQISTNIADAVGRVQQWSAQLKSLDNHERELNAELISAACCLTGLSTAEKLLNVVAGDLRTAEARVAPPELDPLATTQVDYLMGSIVGLDTPSAAERGSPLKRKLDAPSNEAGPPLSKRERQAEPEVSLRPLPKSGQPTEESATSQEDGSKMAQAREEPVGYSGQAVVVDKSRTRVGGTNSDTAKSCPSSDEEEEFYMVDPESE